MAGEVDPLLPLICVGRSLDANNEYRVKLMAEAAVTQRRDPAGFAAFLLAHVKWAQAEAIARDRAGMDVMGLPLLSEDRQVQLLPPAGAGP